MQLPSFEILNHTIYTYPLFMGLGFALFYYFSLGLNEKINEKKLKLFLITSLFFSVIGAKLLFIVSSGKSEYLATSTFWLGGGYVFYGGLIGSAVVAITFSKWMNLKVHELNFLVPSILISHSIGRIGCYLTGCCYGHLIIPIQLLESLLLICGFIISLKWYRKKINLLYLYGIYYSVLRFVLEFYREDVIRGKWVYSMSTSQIISILIMLFCTVAISFNKQHKYVKS